MVNGSSHRRLTPPRFATALIAFAAIAQDRDVLIGDLFEEFAGLAQNSAQSARAWYWRQVALSLPQLLIARMRSGSFAAFARTLIVAFVALALMQVWDTYVARRAAGTFHRMLNADSFGPARIMYYSVQTFGFALAGALIALTTFGKEQSFLKSVLHRLAPAALVLFAPFVIYIVTSSDSYPASMRVMQLAISAPALISGAFVAVKMRRG